MADASGLEILERVAEARGKILRAEGDRAGATVGLLALTFDVGRVVIEPGPSGLVVQTAADRAELPGGIGGLDEEEPWWRLLGHPVTAAWPGGVEEGVGASGLGSLMILKLRFREENENPRVIRIEATGETMRVTLEPV